jgi:hypothetical protein
LIGLGSDWAAFAIHDSERSPVKRMCPRGDADESWIDRLKEWSKMLLAKQYWATFGPHSHKLAR